VNRICARGCNRAPKPAQILLFQREHIAPHQPADAHPGQHSDHHRYHLDTLADHLCSTIKINRRGMPQQGFGEAHQHAVGQPMPVTGNRAADTPMKMLISAAMIRSAANPAAVDGAINRSVQVIRAKGMVQGGRGAGMRVKSMKLACSSSTNTGTMKQIKISAHKQKSHPLQAVAQEAAEDQVQLDSGGRLMVLFLSVSVHHSCPSLSVVTIGVKPRHT